VTVRNFEPTAIWSRPDGTPTERALGWMRAVSPPGPVTIEESLTVNSLVVVDGFGCNGKTAQTEAVVNAAVAGAADGTYSANEQTMLNDLQALVNQLRAALVANGIAV
jgi:hypothetical protein